MADDRTTVTELITGLGTLGFDRLDEALVARPAEMVSVSPEQWSRLDDLYRGGAFAAEFRAAWENGVAFLTADEGLRLRRPRLIEWRGGTKQPGDEPVPADLRIDRVYLVSCKYLSKIVTNSSPAAVFDRLLAGGHGGRAADWYADVALDAYEDLYREVLAYVGSAGQPCPPNEDELTLFADEPAEPRLDVSGQGVDPQRMLVDGLPGSVCALDPGQRGPLKAALGGGRWPKDLRPAAVRFSKGVADATAQRWREALAKADGERVVWRLLRIGSAPYFVLGMAKHPSVDDPLRLRIGTAWDWKQQFELKTFTVEPVRAEQPVVGWRAEVAHRSSRATSLVEGHVEVRWSHGKFAQPPEAKVYLDTPHDQIPGYWPLA